MLHALVVLLWDLIRESDISFLATQAKTLIKVFNVNSMTVFRPAALLPRPRIHISQRSDLSGGQTRVSSIFHVCCLRAPRPTTKILQASTTI